MCIRDRFDSLYNFARWIAHNPNDAEDLVQETYLKALRSFASFQPGTNFRAWMFQIPVSYTHLKQNCPVSKALARTEIYLTAKLLTTAAG